jgi:uncharacterized protein YidB (DUF937 family)
MSEMDKVLGDLLGGKGGADLGSILGGLTGGGGASSGLSGGGSMVAKLLPLLGGLLAGGGLQKILAGLQQQGLGAQANSWVGTGANEPVTGDQVARVLGDQEISQIAQQLGVSNEEAAGELAQVLPQVVDKASPDGQLRSPGELEPAFEQLQQFGAREQ